MTISNTTRDPDLDTLSDTSMWVYMLNNWNPIYKQFLWYSCFEFLIYSCIYSRSYLRTRMGHGHHLSIPVRDHYIRHNDTTAIKLNFPGVMVLVVLWVFNLVTYLVWMWLSHVNFSTVTHPSFLHSQLWYYSYEIKFPRGYDVGGPLSF